MPGNTKREYGVRAPSSIDQENKVGLKEIGDAAQTEKNQKQEVRQFSKDYQENVDSVLRTSNYDEATQKQMRELLSNDQMKAEIVLRASQMGPVDQKLRIILESVLDNKDDISAQFAEKQKALKSLKGKKTYWLGQLSKLTGANGTLETKVKQIKDRVKQLEKQEKNLEVSRLDLKIPLILRSRTKEVKEDDLEELPESAITQLRNAYEAPLVQRDSNMARAEKLERKADVAGIMMEVKMVGDTYVIEFPQSKMNIEIGSDRAMAESVFNYAVKEAGQFKGKKDLTPLIDRVSLVITRAKNFKETREEEEKGLEQDENQRAREMPVVTEGLPAAKKSRFQEGMPGFADFATDDDAKLRHNIEVRAAMSGMLGREEETPEAEIIPNKSVINRSSPSPASKQTIDVMAEPTFAQSPRTETEWWNQEGVEQFTGAWNAVNREMGSGAAEASLRSFGVPKGILQKYQTPQALYQFVENPGFRARYNGNAAATREAINKLIEEASVTRAGSVAESSLAQQGRKDRAYGKETAGGIGQGITIPDIHIPFSRTVEDLPEEDLQKIELAGRPEPTNEWQNQIGESQFVAAWDALSAGMSPDTTESTILSLGMPEHILKKYKTPQALYQFIENPGFWARVNGDASEARKAINRFMESSVATKDSLRIAGEQANVARARTEQSYQQAPTTSADERRR